MVNVKWQMFDDRAISRGPFAINEKWKMASFKWQMVDDRAMSHLPFPMAHLPFFCFLPTAFRLL